MTESIQTRTVKGFALTLGHAGKEWSCDHRQLGEKLGYEADRNYKHFLAFVDRVSNNDPGFQALGTVSASTDTKLTGRGGTATEFRTLHFTRRQALYLIAKSNKPEAATITLAMVDAFDMVLSGARPSVADFVPFLLREDFCEWDEMWSPRILSALCQMYGHAYTPNASPPAFLRSPMSKIYRLVLGDEAYGAMKMANNEPRHGNNLHQMLVEKARERFRAQLPFIESTALDCVGRINLFWERLAHVYMGYQMQLRLSGMEPDSAPVKRTRKQGQS